MPSLPVVDINNKKVGSIDLNDAVFAGEIRPHLINDAVRCQIARRYEFRTANSLTRTEVHGTRKKMFKQKGTGQARHGDAKAPTFVGGGKAHGPKPHRARHKINKKVMRAALISVLTLNQKEDRLFVIDKLELGKPNTKTVADMVMSLGLQSALVVNSNEEKGEIAFNVSGRNVNKVKFIRPEGVNVFDLLKFKNLVISSKAVQKLTERLTAGSKNV
jgi:large subunit ribosomal protein L4